MRRRARQIQIRLEFFTNFQDPITNSLLSTGLKFSYKVHKCQEMKVSCYWFYKWSYKSRLSFNLPQYLSQSELLSLKASGIANVIS